MNLIGNHRFAKLIINNLNIYQKKNLINYWLKYESTIGCKIKSQNHIINR